MKLLIDIPEHIYEHAKEMTEDSIDEGKAMRAIANGSPLPKEHGDIIAEKERLIKKDMGSIENRVRHAFNQGYEMGLKEGCSEIPNTCGDAVSRAIVQEEITKSIELKENPYQLWYRIRALPSVTPQQRTGQWIEVIDETDSLGNKTWHHECSICGSDKSGWGTYKHCPDCGAKMEVE